MRVQSSIPGSVRPEPRLTAVALRCDGAIMQNVPSGLATFKPHDLADHVIVPVSRKRKNITLVQQTEPDWDRYFDDTSENPEVRFTCPVVLSCRGKWKMENGMVKAFDRSIVVDGAKRLEAALSHDEISEVPAIILFGLDPERELALRRDIVANKGTVTKVNEIQHVGTTTPRLMITERWTDVEVLSDPFVTITTRGYVPAILVRRKNQTSREHILIGAKTIAIPIEALRIKRGTLVGARFSTRKQDSNPKAQYLVRVSD